MTNDKRTASEIIIDNCFGVNLNANDTFGWACADAHEVGFYGMEVLKNVAGKFGDAGIDALMAFERGYDVMEERQSKEYFEAKKEIERFLDDWKNGKFKSLYDGYMDELENKRKGDT